jgi:4-amino-4-deoxy-L-arabinose transferase-like glycosyltransferase
MVSMRKFFADRNNLIIALVASLFYFPFLGAVHLFDWDEINFAECAREMILTKDYLRVYINFEPFYQKPPFFFWLQALSMHAFGIGEYAARFPNALLGVINLLLLYNMGKKLYNKKMGLIWAGVFFGSILPHLYSKSAIIDPWFNFFIFTGLYLFIHFYWKYNARQEVRLLKSKYFYLLLGALCIGLAMLTKGPVAYLILFLSAFVFWILKKFRFYVPFLSFVLFSFISLIIMFLWMGTETLVNGPEFMMEFTQYQYRLFSTPDAGHGGFPAYHFVVLLLGCFPASVFAIRGLFKQEHEYEYQKDFKLWMLVLFWVVLILFSLVKSKIVHYSSLAYYPLTYLAALSVYRIIEGKALMGKFCRIALWVIASLYSLVIILIPYFGRNIEKIRGLFSKDTFAMANLDASVHWSGWEIIPAVFLLLVLLYFFWQANKKKYQRAFLVLFSGTAVFVFLTLVFFIARIEKYSQNAAIEFFKEQQGKDSYVLTKAYKSYAHLFYSRKEIPENPKSLNTEWLLRGDIDKDLYISTKINKLYSVEDVPCIRETGRKNGYVFFIRPK